MTPGLDVCVPPPSIAERVWGREPGLAGQASSLYTYQGSAALQ